MEIPCTYGNQKEAQNAVALKLLNDLASHDVCAQKLLVRVQEAASLPLLAPPPSLPINLVRGQKYPLEEGRNIEFKGGLDANEHWSVGNARSYLKEVSGEYISAFLNSRIAGRLMFGIHDNGTIQGIRMQAKDKDNARLAFDNNVLPHFYPIVEVKRNLVLFEIIPIQDRAGSSLMDLHLISVTVLPAFGDLRVYFFKEFAYVKREASRTAMKPAEFVERLKKAFDVGQL